MEDLKADTEAAGAAHIVPVDEAATLDGLFRERVRRTPDLVAYRHYNEPHANWRDYTWAHMERLVARCQAALRAEGLQPGDRVAIMLRNCPEWVAYDIAALGLGLIVVPVYTQDRPENEAFRDVVNRAETAAEQLRLTRDYFAALESAAARPLCAAA